MSELQIKVFTKLELWDRLKGKICEKEGPRCTNLFSLKNLRGNVINILFPGIR